MVKLRSIASATLLALAATACSRNDTSSSVVTDPTRLADTAAEPATESIAPRPTDQQINPGAAAYIDAVNSHDLDAIVASFASDGVVIDVSREIAGTDAIRDWADREVIGGALEVIEIAEQRADGQRILVQWAPAGSSGWRALYDFTVFDGVITVADLQYAN